MATSGSITGSTQKLYKFWVDWTRNGDYSIENNSSNITVSLKVQRIDGSNSGAYNLDKTPTVTLTINNIQQDVTRSYIDTRNKKICTFATWTGDVNHNDDGTLNCPITASFTTSGSTTLSSGNLTGTLELDTIPRASTFDEISCSTAYFNGEFTYKYTPKSESFYNQLRIYLKTSNDQYGLIKTINLGQKRAESQIEYVALSSTELEKIYGLMPTKTNGSLRFKLRTCLDSEYDTLIGNSVDKDISLDIPMDIVPSIDDITLNPEYIEPGGNILVKGKNKLTISVSGGKAGLGSSIKSYTFAGPGISSTTMNISVTSENNITNVGVLTYTVKVTDQRERSTSLTKTIECYDYSVPLITSFNVYRSDPDGKANVNGSYLQCDYTPKYSSVNGTNDATVTIYYNDQSETNTVTDTSGKFFIDLNGDITKTYKVYLKITDSYDGSTLTATVNVLGQSRVFNISPDGMGIAVGKISERKDNNTNGLFECAFDAKFYKNVEMIEPLSINNGGTGATDAVTALNNMGAAPIEHNHDATDINSGILPLSRGGTGLTSNPSMLVDLASTTGYSVFSTNPRPGITGTLPIAHGGTGATNADEALENFGAVKIVKLWENASHTSAFDAQMLTINDLSNYDMVLILFSATTAASYQSANVFIPKEKTGIGHYVTEARYDGGHYTSGRTATANFSDNNIVFGNGSQNGTNNTSRMIPLCIYGIKGVLS